MLSTGHVRKITGCDIFLAPQGPFDRLKRELPRGVWGHASPGNLKEKTLRNVVPVFLETKNQFPRQGWSSLKFSLTSNIFNENGQIVRDGGGVMATTEFSVVYHCQVIFYRISKDIR